MKNNKSQAAIFLIIGIVMIMVVASLFLLTRYSIKKSTKQEAIESKESVFDIQPIKNFVTECLDSTSKEALTLLGKQGGYLFKSQGGMLIGYQDQDEGLFFINYTNSKVVYNILKPGNSAGDYYATVPNYPWITFPYESDLVTENFFAKGAFGTNNMPPLNKSFGPYSLQEQLTEYTTNNMDNCLDFSIFEEQGFSISKKDKTIRVDINDNDIIFRMNYNIEIENLVSNEKTTINEFLVKQNIRLGKLHDFANNLIESDISHINFSIAENTGADHFAVNIVRDQYNKDDIVIITDLDSQGTRKYTYTFSRKNRNPVLYYLTPEDLEDLTKPTYIDGTTDLTIIDIDDLITNYPEPLKALDPDEDIITADDFSIKTIDGKGLPVELSISPMKFKVNVTDGELEDFQIITVTRIP